MSWTRGARTWDENPIRAELFSVERLADHGRSLAAAQAVAAKPSRRETLAHRLADNEAALLASYRSTAQAIADGASITPAAEWLIDNFHVVEAQVRQVRSDLPGGYYRQLPKLAGEPFAGLPRVFGVVWAFVAHTDSLFDAEVLCRYVRAYQEVQPLTIGELWAVAITLRIVLVENLRRIADRIVASRLARRDADILADRILGVRGRVAEPSHRLLAAAEATAPPDAFHVQLMQRLRDQDHRVAPALAWVEQRLAVQETTAEAVVREEHQRQVSASITVRNIITSMRLISDLDWSELVERMSLVDDILRAHGPYREMDFPTRNLYRTAIEVLSRGSALSELQVAQAAMLAAQTAGREGDPRLGDPGYHLFAAGRQAFEAAIGFRAPARTWPSRLYRSLGIGGYVGGGAIFASAFLAVPVLASLDVPWPWLLALALGGSIPAIDAGVAMVNHLVTRGFRATLLPALALESGIPDPLRTLVAVPTLLTSPQAIDELIERLEIHFLSSPEGAVHFALLSDWADADQERTELDDELLALAQAGIEELNRRHGAAPGGPRFLLLHRRRVWSRSERRWIGWERKRGKLCELNRLLRGAEDTTFLGPATPLAGIRYVVTLDSDTRLPPETVRRLIGKMAHPLNHPRLDPGVGRVVEGYALLQPRVTPALPVGREGSLFLRVFSSASGIDPYAAAVSDVYQDLFGEGSYTGKGIYDLDAFEAALSGRVPEGVMLSHDLFEGIFARAGLVSDVEVVEDFPPRYDVAALRHHRWARGDWQLLPWILGSGPRRNRPERTDVPAIGRWKMLDNLRRSVSSPASVLVLVAAWFAPSGAAVWTGFVVAAMALPALLPIAAAAPRRAPGVPLAEHLRTLRNDLGMALSQLVLMLTFLGHQAWLMGDAILRTLFRLGVTRRRLLEWTPAASAAFGAGPSLRSFYRRMAGGVGLGLVAAWAAWTAWTTRQGAWPIALAFAGLWIASPAIALAASRSERVAGRFPLGLAERTRLRLTARRTWRFFETFVTASTHMLPPDNFQETPQPVVARRTSPTNIGLYLLSVVAARDFGWIGAVEAVERLEATFATLRRLERSHGHLFNWYDTGDLRPLDPRYVSSVDSGNLAGHLLALAGACREWRGPRADPAAAAAGVSDALALAREAAEALARAPGPLPVARSAARSLDAIAAGVEGPDFLRPGGLADALERLFDVARAAAIEAESPAGEDLLFWVDAIRRAIESHGHDSRVDDGALAPRLAALEQAARAMAMEMDFALLLDRNRLLLSIGYKPAEGALDENCYDLLASEARLASFFAIAKGDAPARHWFRLGRSVTPVARGAALISWSGSMFEYLMPSLVMRAPTASLIEQTNRLVVRRQIDYGRALGTPWGVSESAFNARDLEFTYQYSNFGIPGLGLKRGLADNTVIAPYATGLAAMVAPREAAQNLDRLTAAGGRGRHGFYEALDFTPARVPEGQVCAVVQTYMAHHQGMTIVAIDNTLLDGPMRRRFHADPIVQATELLLQERVPREVVPTPPPIADSALVVARLDQSAPGWRIADPWSGTPDVQILSNGGYSVVLTGSGSGYSTWGGLAVTRWREDPTCDDRGSYFFLRDLRTDEVWSPSLQPTGALADQSSVVFNEDKVEFIRRDGALDTSCEVIVSPEDDAEVRRITISNTGLRVREIEVTSYQELVLAPHGADLAHPAFSKLFIETEHLPATGALTARRRQRSPEEPAVWAAHVAVVQGDQIGKPEFGTDRARFIGRGRDIRSPSAMNGRPLSSATDAVLDPIFALRRRLRIPPGQSAQIDFWTLVAGSREDLLGLIDKHHDPAAFERAAALAWTQAQVQLHHLGIDRSHAARFQRLASHILFASPVLRPSSDILAAGAGAQSQLWRLGISGDLPIVLVRVQSMPQLDLAREVLEAVEYLRLKAVAVDLVVLNERGASYVQDLQSELEALVRANQSRPQIRERRAAGHIFMLRADLIAPELQALLVSSARVVLSGNRGRLAEQLENAPHVRVAPRPPPPRPAPPSDLHIGHHTPGVEFFNGFGGFSQDGKEYVTITGPGQTTPAPWVNVIANPEFGFLVSADGGGFTWSGNARERQLTPWSNDPVTDTPGQALYIADRDSGELWTPAAGPVRDPASAYTARHGFGYSRFEHASRGLLLELVEFVPLGDSVRLGRLLVRNTSSRSRRLSVTAYVEWVLGRSREATAQFLSTRIDTATGAMLAANPWDPAFQGRVAFLDLGGDQVAWTGDRREFLGRNGSMVSPVALTDGQPLSGRVGSGLDPCGALQAPLDLAPGQQAELTVLLGDAASETEARTLIERYRAADLDAVLDDVRGHWDALTGAVQVMTPDRSMDLMLNGWLVYQTLACRLWARTGFYQASGAYGFRDQLQDVLALAPIRPSIAREHLLRAAARQFPEGDVQHWWLPHTGQGVRTRISDDRLWLPYAVAGYLEVTGDAGVLDEAVAFLTGPALEPDQAEAFFAAATGAEAASLYEHCARAIDVSLTLGAHGLPLIGGGDWNDGFNRVGAGGRGESTWLGWFQITVLRKFAPLAEAREDEARATLWRTQADRLTSALEAEGWDGAWYRRGWFDDGLPLGSAASEECRIDSIAQSWSALSGAGSPERVQRAMAEVERELILPQEGVALLFTPPFDTSAADPGYVKGYPPGIRENGGQYTHAALWTVMAFAALGDGDRATALFALLNPVNHARTRTDAHRYKVEPYVAAADVYANPAHLGRGGWTWYTGSSGWMLRAGLESILGLSIRGDDLLIDPCIPKGWPGFEASVRRGNARYDLAVENPDGVCSGVRSVELDGRPMTGAKARVRLVEDGKDHSIRVVLGPPPIPAAPIEAAESERSN